MQNGSFKVQTYKLPRHFLGLSSACTNFVPHYYNDMTNKQIDTAWERAKEGEDFPRYWSAVKENNNKNAACKKRLIINKQILEKLKQFYNT